MQKDIERAVRSLLKFLIRIYQILLSPILGNNCRFYPTCSAYAVEAIDKHGAMIGLWLSVNRMFRCNPWHDGGYDPVPSSDKITKFRDKTITVSSGGVLKNDR